MGNEADRRASDDEVLKPNNRNRCLSLHSRRRPETRGDGGGADPVGVVGDAVQHELALELEVAGRGVRRRLKLPPDDN
jgi:hypothetical protein